MTTRDENGPVTPTRPERVAQAKAVATTTAAQNVQYLLLSTGIGLSALLAFLVLNTV
ncbi:hypothetical protein [Amaricoccus tamworthensis]|uniref:hypothetical protein n=1 Tax=Amaricoccus tamworthensis TaxID=57002 RepID=UPI003C7A9E89